MKYLIPCIIAVLLLLAGCAEEPKACTMEAKLCPDGSSVGRVAPECEFAACPESVEAPVAEAPIIEEEAPSEEPQDSSLVAYWEFEENAEDSAGSNDGIVKGSAAFVDGKSGKAISFDGVDDYVEFSSDAVSAIGGLTEGTIAFWFKYESLLEKQTVMPLFYIGGEERDSDNMYIIEIGHFNERGFGVDPSNKKIYSTWIKDNKDPFLCFDTNMNMEENQWHHYAVVVSPSGNTGYLNGVELTGRNYNFGNKVMSPFLSSIPAKKKLMIGYGRSSAAVGPDFVFFKGAVDDYRIYSKALSAEEIKELAA